MSSIRVRARRSRHAWRALRWSCVSLGLAAGGCLLSKVEFEGPEAQGTNDLTGSGGSGSDAGSIVGNDAAAGSDGSNVSMVAQGGSGNLCALMPGSDGCPPAGPPAGAVGSTCASNQGCFSLHCAEGLCVAATCDDTIINQDETDQDCGGRCPDRCDDSQACLVDADCGEGLFCPPETRRCTPASCQDRVLNGSELLIDCGGGVCPGCPNGTTCSAATDCASSVCGAGSVCEASRCDDGVLNGTETGIDCGGPCGLCALGSSCTDSAECQSGICATIGCPPGVSQCCVSSTCSDNVRNGRETDVDCGGLDCPRCADRSSCGVNTDCVNNDCFIGVCISCGDGVLTGTETGLDCGGADPFCRRCNVDEPCLSNTDCASQFCVNGRCT
jgi:hypothetical protein